MSQPGNLRSLNRRADALALLHDQIKANAGAGLLITHSKAAADTADRIYVLDSLGLAPAAAGP